MSNDASFIEPDDKGRLDEALGNHILKLVPFVATAVSEFIKEHGQLAAPGEDFLASYREFLADNEAFNGAMKELSEKGDPDPAKTLKLITYFIHAHMAVMAIPDEMSAGGLGSMLHMLIHAFNIPTEHMIQVVMSTLDNLQDVRVMTFDHDDPASAIEAESKLEEMLAEAKKIGGVITRH